MMSACGIRERKLTGRTVHLLGDLKKTNFLRSAWAGDLKSTSSGRSKVVAGVPLFCAGHARYKFDWPRLLSSTCVIVNPCVTTLRCMHNHAPGAAHMHRVLLTFLTGMHRCLVCLRVCKIGHTHTADHHGLLLPDDPALQLMTEHPWQLHSYTAHPISTGLMLSVHAHTLKQPNLKSGSDHQPSQSAELYRRRQRQAMVCLPHYTPHNSLGHSEPRQQALLRAQLQQYCRSLTACAMPANPPPC
jgi:hypothetical protein